MSKKVWIIILVAVVAIGAIAGIMAYTRSAARKQEAGRPEHRDRYYDTEALLEASMKMERPNAVITGVVVNNTWKTRAVAVWAGFVKSDGFHEGSTTGRNYYGYLYFPEVAPKEKKPFSIEIAVPPLNRSWSAVAEFDPKESRLRPIWAP